MAASHSPGGFIFASFLSGRLSKISKWVWPKCLSDCCLYAGSKCPLRAESQFPTALQLSLYPHWFSKSDILGAHLSWGRLFGLGSLPGVQIPHSYRKTSVVGFSMNSYELLYQESACWLDWFPLLLISLWLLYIFNCRKSFLLDFRSLSVIVALWEEVCSGSSYSTILIPLLTQNVYF